MVEYVFSHLHYTKFFLGTELKEIFRELKMKVYI
jgi:hypothetical protein